MNVIGNHQTAFADWARAVITHYPYDLTYKLDEETATVYVFNGESKIAHYDFGHGNGQMVDTKEKKITDIGRWESFQEINVDKMMHLG